MDTKLLSPPFIRKKHSKERIKAQAASRQPLTAEARVRSRASSREICGGQSEYLRFNEYSTNAPYSPSS
jgi:hypothetical protein